MKNNCIDHSITYQHGSSDVELLLELRDKDMHGDEVLLVLHLHFTDDVCHPLELTLCTGHPDEVHLGITQRQSKATVLQINLYEPCQQIVDIIYVAHTP